MPSPSPDTALGNSHPHAPMLCLCRGSCWSPRTCGMNLSARKQPPSACLDSVWPPCTTTVPGPCPRLSIPAQTAGSQPLCPRWGRWQKDFVAMQLNGGPQLSLPCPSTGSCVPPALPFLRAPWLPLPSSSLWSPWRPGGEGASPLWHPGHREPPGGCSNGWAAAGALSPAEKSCKEGTPGASLLPGWSWTHLHGGLQ